MIESVRDSETLASNDASISCESCGARHSAAYCESMSKNQSKSWDSVISKARVFWNTWVCLKIVYPYTQWLMIIIPTKWLFHWGYTTFSDIPTGFIFDCGQESLRVHFLMKLVTELSGELQALPEAMGCDWRWDWNRTPHSVQRKWSLTKHERIDGLTSWWFSKGSTSGSSALCGKLWGGSTRAKRRTHKKDRELPDTWCMFTRFYDLDISW